MKFYRVLLSIVSAFALMPVVAQDVVTYDVVAGNLATLIDTESYTTLEDIKLTGTVDARDFYFIRDNITEVKTLDMSEATIVACEYEGISYPANTIPDNAFYVTYSDFGLRRMTTFYFPHSVEAIGEHAFYMCPVLRTTNMEQLTALHTIGAGSLSRCMRLREVTIPASVEVIGTGAFAYNVMLGKVVIAEGSRLHTLGDNAFNGSVALTSLDFSKTALVEVGAQAFNACTKLKSVLLPASVEYVGDEAFMYSAVETIDWSHMGLLQVIEGSTFYGMGALQRVVLPHSVAEIKSSAFADCSRLEQVGLSYSLLSIGDWAFSGCSALSVITLPAPSVPSVGYRAFENVSTANVTLKVDETILAHYEADIDWSAFALQGVSYAHSESIVRDEAKVKRYGNECVIESLRAMTRVYVYSYDGSLLITATADDCQARLVIPSTTRYVVRVEYVDGTCEVIKC